MESSHAVGIDLEKLDGASGDAIERVIKSMDFENKHYENLKLDDIERRDDIIKVRILTKKSFEASSREFDRKMK